MSGQLIQSFNEIVHLIQNARQRTLRTVNSALIELYWNVGEYINRKVEAEEWGRAVVQQLADYIQRCEPELRGFSASNLWRMRQFYMTYQDSPILATLLRELP